MGTTVSLSHYDADADETYTIALTGDKDTITRLDDRLQKKLGKMNGLDEPRSVVMDHLQCERIFIITYISKAGATKGAWEKKEEIMTYAQEVGHTWKLSIVDANRGINKNYYVAFDSVDAPDIGGESDDHELVISFIETKNWEGQP